MAKDTLLIKGMHCRSCELLIEEKLKEIPGIKNVDVNYKNKSATFELKSNSDIALAENAVRDAGYEIGLEEKGWISQNPAEYKDLGLAFLILVVLYFIAKQLGIINLSVPGAGNHSSLSVVFIVGLTAGVSTCMALVGGLILGVAARFSEKHPEATPLQKFRPQLFFILGRILGYALLGGLIGLLGHAFQLSSLALGVLTIVVGLVMLVLGLQLTELFPKISSAKFTLPPSIAKFLGLKNHSQKEYSHTSSMLTGALTFFLPCGFTQAMQLYAMSTGNFWQGALIMGVFALGTAPGLLGVGGLTSFIKGAYAKKFFKFAGLLVIALSIFNLSNGLNLTGLKGLNFSFKSSQTVVKDDPNVKLVDGVQVVNMTQTSYGYTPAKFTIKQGIPVKWVIDGQDANSCSSSLLAPAINVKQVLAQGINTINFTPQKVGTIRFTCSMGMYSGVFNVVPNSVVSPATSAETVNATTNSVPSPSPLPSVTAVLPSNVQVIKTTYVSSTLDIQPKIFSVNAGQPVHFEVTSEVDGQGCMSTIGVPGLTQTAQFLEKGKTISFDFTPQKKGSYNITCGMGAPRGRINVL